VKELEEVDPYASSVGVLGGALAATSLDKDLDDDDVFTTPPVAAKTAPPSPAQSAALGDDGFDDDGFDTPAQTAAVASTSLDNGFGDDDRFEDDGGFDDFDDFDAPTATFDDDGFGDFGDFEEGEAALEPIEAPAPAPPAPVLPVVDWVRMILQMNTERADLSRPRSLSALCRRGESCCHVLQTY
jgi:hypothetical protein